MLKIWSLKCLIVLMCFGITSAHGQKLEIENIQALQSLKKDSYLGNVEYNETDKTTILHYVERDVLNTNFVSYYFDENLNFIKEEQKSYNIIDATKDMINEIKSAFSWFDYRGESYTREYIDIMPGLGGKIVASRQVVTFNFNWTFGTYLPSYAKPIKIEIKGETEEKIYLYDHIVNTKLGETYMLVGTKAPSGTKKDKYRHAREFQIIKVNKDLEPEYLEKITFEHNMAISFSTMKYNEGYVPNEQLDVADIHNGKWYLIFSPIKTMLGKKFNNPNAGENTLVVMNDKGKINMKIDYTAETTGWVVRDIILTNNGDLFFYGPAKEDAYINKLMPTNSPLTGKDEIADIKWKNFQVMKISNNEFKWIHSTDLKEFKANVVTPPSQKRSPDYSGKNFETTLTFVTNLGELIIAGQNFTTKNIDDPNSTIEGAKIKVIDAYKDLIMFHFDDQGILKAQYGIRRDKMNKWSKASLTPQYVYLSNDSKRLYWVYGEIKGMRQGFQMGGALEAAGVGTLSKKKLLFYPTVSEINLGQGTLSDFVPLGADKEGKQKYFTDPNFPQLLSPDGKHMTFIGEDKKGVVVWLARMAFN